MFIVTVYEFEAKAMHVLHDTKFQESQLKRIEAIAALKACGDALIAIRNGLAPASKSTPVETDVGTFTSFREYLNAGTLNFSVQSAYKYIKLAENWDIVLRLGMQDEKNAEKCMRLIRTLKIIDWYKSKLEEGWDEELLTLDLYWEEENSSKPSSDRPTYKELQIEVSYLRSRVKELEARLEVKV